MPIVRFADNEDHSVLVEVDEVPSLTPQDIELRGRRAEQVLDVARDVFGDGIDLVGTCARRVGESISQLEQSTGTSRFQLENLDLQFAIKLDAELGAVIVKATAGAQLQVTVQWSRVR